MKPSKRIEQLVVNRLEKSECFQKLDIRDLNHLQNSEAALIAIATILDFLDEKIPFWDVFHEKKRTEEKNVQCSWDEFEKARTKLIHEFTHHGLDAFQIQRELELNIGSIKFIMMSEDTNEQTN